MFFKHLRSRVSLGFVALLFSACGSGQELESTTPPDDTPAALSWQEQSESGAVIFDEDARITVPAGWRVAEDGSALRLKAPEGDLEVLVIPWGRLIGADEEERAREVVRAWQTVDGDFEREPAGQRDVPGSPWDTLFQVAFTTAPSEHRGLAAFGAVSGSRGYVIAIDGTTDALSRRGAEVNVLVTSLELDTMNVDDWSVVPPRELDDAALERFAERVEAARREDDVPGAVVLVANVDEVLFSQGFGVTHEGGEAITADTRFMIGSMTKPFVSLLAARLVDRERITWDTPVANVLPEFRFADDAVTRELTIAHTLCACTGMPRRDLEMLFELNTPAEILATVADSSPTTGFGETFQYSNQLVDIGGFALARVVQEDASVDELLTAFAGALSSEVLEPLGMENTTLTSAEAQQGPYARPHAQTIDDEVVEIAVSLESLISQHGPAGGLWSTANDLVNYARLELQDGLMPDGSRLVEADTLARRRLQQVPVSANAHYGLGLIVTQQNRLPAFGHGGGTLGFSTDLVILPTLGVAVIVLTNRAGASTLTSAVAAYWLEAMLGVETQVDLARAEHARLRGQASAQMAEMRREASDADKQRLVGSYVSSSLGELEIRLEDGQLIADVGEWESPLGRVEQQGESGWIFLGPPLAGLRFEVVEGTSNLRVLFPQSNHVFERQ